MKTSEILGNARRTDKRNGVLTADRMEFYYSYMFLFDKCDQCGKCCVQAQPTVTGKELVHVSRTLNMNGSKFKQMYVDGNISDGKFRFKQPCPFYNVGDRKCIVYDSRPNTCREYPIRFCISQRQVALIGVGYCPLATRIYTQLCKFNKQDVQDSVINQKDDMSSSLILGMDNFTQFLELLESENIKPIFETVTKEQIDRYDELKKKDYSKAKYFNMPENEGGD